MFKRISVRAVLFVAALAIVGALVLASSAEAFTFQRSGGARAQTFRPMVQSRPAVRQSFVRQTFSRPTFSRPAQVSRQRAPVMRRQAFRPSVRPSRVSSSFRPRPISTPRRPLSGALAHRQGGGNRPNAISHLPHVNSPVLAHLPENRTPMHPTGMSHLPRPGSLGTAHLPGTGQLGRPSVLAHLPPPNSIGTSHPAGGSGAGHPLSAMRLPQPNSIGGGTHPATTSARHPLDVAHLPAPNSIGTGANSAPRTAQTLSAPHQNTRSLLGDVATIGVGVATGGVGGAVIAAVGAKKAIGDVTKPFGTAPSPAEQTHLVTSDTGFTNASKTTPPTPVQISKGPIKLTGVATGSKGPEVPKAIQASQLANQQKTAGGNVGTSAAHQPQVECIVAPCPKHFPTSQTSPTSTANATAPSQQPAQQDASTASVTPPVSVDVPAPAVDDTPAVVVAPAPQVVLSTPVTAPPPVVTAPVAPVAIAPLPQRVVPRASRPMPAPSQVATAVPVAPTDPTPAGVEFVLVTFQPGVSDDDIAVFLKAYDVSIVDGPASDGVVKLHLASPLAADQMQQVVDSMKSQTNIIATAAGG